jgi:uncharacterized membrane protein YfhO
VYRLDGARPLAELHATGAGGGTVTAFERRGDGIETVVDASGAGRLVVREACAAGWEARVDGRTTAVECVEGRHLGVAVAGGRRRVSLRYRPPRWLPGLAVSALSALVVAWLGRPFRRRPGSPDGASA